jgi:uncharacterized protein YbjT (DUF2867 family)
VGGKWWWMRIAITTPTGNVGSELLGMFVRANVRPLVLMRDPLKLPRAVAPFVEAVAVDQSDGTAVKSATVGVDAIYWVNPPAFTDADPIAAHIAFGQALCSAAADNGIPRIVFQSSVGAEKRHGMGDIDGLARTEEMLDRLPVSTTHIRCGYFFTNLLMDVEGLRAGRLNTTVDLEARLPWVHPRDIAEMAFGALLSSSAEDAHLMAAHGPRDLSFTEVAAIITEATGKRVTASRITDDELRNSLAATGMSEKAVEAIVGMSSGARDGFVPEIPRSALTTTPSMLEEWCYSRLRPLLT